MVKGSGTELISVGQPCIFFSHLGRRRSELGFERSEPALLRLHHLAHQRALRERRCESQLHLGEIPGEVSETAF